MLSAPDGWVEMVEVNPPRLPSMLHRELRGRWPRVLITDNPFKQVRVSPYAFAARITHDIPEVQPTVVCSTRDRNILAIESEVRGALANGVGSFLVVQGDMLPEVEHWSNNYEIVEHLRNLQEAVSPVEFEVGMSTRSRSWMFRRRIEVGGQFFTTGPVMDPESVGPCAERLELQAGDPPVYLEVTPPFSPGWVKRLEGVGTVKISDALRDRLASTPDSQRRDFAWRIAKGIANRARTSGFAGVVLMGLRFETAVGEAYDVWHDSALSPIDSADIEAASESHRAGASSDQAGAVTPS
ncbi:MAG: methylenetetrahydrofolate reductase [Chloroflexi bacterium]|nr:methylenetetrahydrofolate reductase [Chloroflexota bacterium]